MLGAARTLAVGHNPRAYKDEAGPETERWSGLLKDKAHLSHPPARTSSLIALSLRTSSDLDFSHRWRDSKWLCFAVGRAPPFCLATHLCVPTAALMEKESENYQRNMGLVHVDQH